MKKIVFLFILIFLNACSNNELPKVEEGQLSIIVDNLEGAWLAVEKKIDHGTEPRFFEPIAKEDQYTYIFFNNLTVEDSSIECIGNYELNEQSHLLKLNYKCITDEIKWKVSSLTSEEMILKSKISIELYIVKFKRQTDKKFIQ